MKAQFYFIILNVDFLKSFKYNLIYMYREPIDEGLNSLRNQVSKNLFADYMSVLCITHIFSNTI